MKPETETLIFKIGNKESFSKFALDIFRMQSAGNNIYRDFIKNLRVDPEQVKSAEEIPFLPASFFRTQKVITGDFPHEKVFESSGTTGSESGRHYVVDLSLYEKTFVNIFMYFYGKPSDYMIAALLPSYTERENSSLVYMMENLINMSSYKGSGFYKNEYASLLTSICEAREEEKKILLLGVSFALLDFAEKHSPDLHDVIVMETGGMKGRRKEITREELHTILKKAFNLKVVHSEYGMTELLSQAYSKGEGIFNCPPWMKIFIRDPQDPLTIIKEPGITGGINIIDLANIHSCSFISTGDLGKLHADGSFEILGRIDNSDIRGCNLLIE
jgi:phenylacetate-coenzyme A ligase PaaK-like adenylate-forming protein